MKKQQEILSLVCLTLIIALTGCATIMHGTRQGISISSVPTGATVTIDGQSAGKTPISPDLSRKEKHLVKIELEGYMPFEMYVNRKVSGWVWGNVAFGGLIGLAVDAISGGLYNLTPELVQAQLSKQAYKLEKDRLYIVTVLQVDPSWQKIGNLKPSSAQ